MGSDVDFSYLLKFNSLPLDSWQLDICFDNLTEGFFMIFPLSRKHFTMNFPVEALMPSYLAARLIEYPLLDARSMSLILI